jgi:hypothetical protein
LVVSVNLLLLIENRRLKRGNFTPEEFQNLCHNLSEKDKEKFFQGCAEYQRKLFGEAAVDRLQPKTCIRRAGHMGPCNGFPREDCLHIRLY